MVSDSKTVGILPNQSDGHCTKYEWAEMNDSSSSATRIIVKSDTERTPIRTGQWYNAGSRFRGTRSLPYAYWDSECQSERAPAWRRTPSGVVSCTVQERQSCEDQQIKHPRVSANNHAWRANHVILQGKNDSSVQLDHSSRRLPFCGGILPFWITNQEQQKWTVTQRSRETERFQRQLKINRRN